MPAQKTSTSPGEAIPGRGFNRLESDASGVDVLRESINLPFSGRIAKNRFLKAPMTERLCSWNVDSDDITQRGIPSKELINLYKKWGNADIGIIVSGNIMIRYDAVEAFGNPILCDNHDNRLEQFKELASVAKAHGSLFLAQLSHPGRQGIVALNPNPVSASDVQLQAKWLDNSFAKPRALSVPEIHDLVRRYGETAYLCHQAGFDGVQIHCAHGYLLAQFLSGTTNLRTDEYGGNMENRSRIILEIIAEVRRRVPDPSFVLCAKVNSVEFQAGGTTPEDFKFLCTKLEEARLDLLELSGGTFESRAFQHKKESTVAREAFFIEFADMIRPHLKTTKVYVTGGFRTAGGMVSAVNGGSCHGIGIGRPLASEPYLCRELLNGTITGALENLSPVSYLTLCSGTQLHQIALGDKAISDWSSQEEVDRWHKALEIENQHKASIFPRVDRSGYPRITAVNGFEYETYVDT